METISDLIDYAESNFICQIGDQKAAHHFPDNNICLPYVVYAGMGPSEQKLTEWLLGSVFKPLLVVGGKRLFWRNEEKIECRQATDDEETIFDRSLYRTYTRLLVVDKDNNPIRIDEYIKPEGELIREIDSE